MCIKIEWGNCHPTNSVKALKATTHQKVRLRKKRIQIG